MMPVKTFTARLSLDRTLVLPGELLKKYQGCLLRILSPTLPLSRRPHLHAFTLSEKNNAWVSLSGIPT